MDNTIPVKLEIISLELAEKSDDNFMCSISLMKGMQNFGQIKFQIDKEYTEYTFSDQKIIKFFYTPRLASRKDVFFRIILTDLESRQQMGDIPISTHLLVDTFKNDKITVIEEKKDFFEGVSLTYKIHQTAPQLSITERQSGFYKQHESNDFISKLFSRPEFQDDQLIDASIKKSRKNSHSEPQHPPPEPKPADKQESVPLIKLIQNAGSQQSLNSDNTKDEQNRSQPKININPPSILNLLMQKQDSNPMKHSTTQLHSSQLLNRIFGLVRNTQLQQQKKKHAISSKQSQHHSEHKLSKKLKLVIFLLIFGFLMTVLDVYGDKQEQKILKKASKKAKTTEAKSKKKQV